MPWIYDFLGSFVCQRLQQYCQIFLKQRIGASKPSLAGQRKSSPLMQRFPEGIQALCSSRTLQLRRVYPRICCVLRFSPFHMDRLFPSSVVNFSMLLTIKTSRILKRYSVGARQKN